MKSSSSIAIGDLLQTIAGRRDSLGREPDGGNSTHRHLSHGVVVPSSLSGGGCCFDSALKCG